MKNTKLWEQVDRILWEDWDPIGVNDFGLEDEYSSYVPSIINLLNQNADEHKIAKLLLQHANQNMGCSTRIEDHLKVAKQLKQLSSK